MGFRVFFPITFILLFSLFCIHYSSAQTVGFRCTTTTTCNSIIDYKLPNTTTLSSVRTLFEIKNLRTLLAANNLPITTPQHQTFNASQILKIPFPCSCRNGFGISNRQPNYTVVPDDGLYHIAAEVFSNLVTYQQIQTVNNIMDANLIRVGQKLWIPLPCSCDDVDGKQVVHYGRLVASGESVGGIAGEYNTTESTLLNLNGMNNSSELMADSIIDVPLQVCTSSVRNNSLDYPLLVPNGTYIFTANNCVRCQCNGATSWILDCAPSGITSSRGTCPSTQCSGTSFHLGNITSDSSCGQTRCAYAGYTNATIFTTLSQESTCAGGNNDTPGNGGNNNRTSGNGSKGLRSSFVLGVASFIALHLLG